MPACYTSDPILLKRCKSTVYLVNFKQIEAEMDLSFQDLIPDSNKYFTFHAILRIDA